MDNADNLLGILLSGAAREGIIVAFLLGLLMRLDARLGQLLAMIGDCLAERRDQP